ncbi:MAG: acyl-CoA/acyl-ACP dehydrogenase [Polaromonas sp.]|jgi:alkylation response protein AidB-like acyl-CoA dehydrogenase|uniref:acyl-CoA dehydrogenase family protein n=1 Tax=Polaromonas sp. TaxID=1869339 RepID=UPI002489C1F7|nr:acyl-CoA dehydrogenase family protein [Polaromonas sp.]MDI1236473.1 acyl-CoA/acyl-ACP dehydrogenase [Polaromonas sp.]MDI1339575.1 acyl-CoA/acyl-ACP dehydrogenase [Polaromonas sp.]MDP1566997.1 acyl-CoA dehydrogenase family protein [Polaromonas sp.]MDP3166621.1 acyl-CoA dehydrogenase family protein [Hydrogenophaga sp.]
MARQDWNTFGLTEHQRIIRDSVLDLLQGVMSPEKIRELDRAGEFPFEAYRALADAGWMSLPFSEEVGGSGGSHKDLAVLVEAMAYHYASMATAYLTTVIYAGQHIALHGSEHLKSTYLPGIMDGSIRMAIALTEPGAGSDAAAITTRAERRGDSYVVNGQKLYITCAHVAQYLVAAVKTSPQEGHLGISILLIPTNAKGVSIRMLDTLGRRSTRATEVFFDNVEVAAENLIGEENKGWRGLMKCLNMERMCLAAAGAGNMQHVIDYAKDYAIDRVQFGQPITRFQAVAHKFADMRIMAEITRLMTYRVAEMLDSGIEPRIETAMAKVVSTDNDFACANLGMQIMGGAGYMMEHDMQRFFRDSRIGPVGGGSNEIQRNIIAQMMGL